MANTFFPVVSTFVNATAGYHPQNTDYKVSIGYEINDGDSNCLVFKIQICYDGKISGRRSPSFPIDSPDWTNIKSAMDKIKIFYDNQSAPTLSKLRNCII